MDLGATATLELVNAAVTMSDTPGSRANTRWMSAAGPSVAGVRDTLRTMQGPLAEAVNVDSVRHLFSNKAWQTPSGAVDPTVKLFRVNHPQYPNHEHIVLVRARDTTALCTCPFWTMWGIPCRHFFAVWQSQWHSRGARCEYCASILRIICCWLSADTLA